MGSGRPGRLIVAVCRKRRCSLWCVWRGSSRGVVVEVSSPSAGCGGGGTRCPLHPPVHPRPATAPNRASKMPRGRSRLARASPTRARVEKRRAAGPEDDALFRLLLRDSPAFHSSHLLGRLAAEARALAVRLIGRRLGDEFPRRLHRGRSFRGREGGRVSLGVCVVSSSHAHLLMLVVSRAWAGSVGRMGAVKEPVTSCGVGVSACVCVF